MSFRTEIRVPTTSGRYDNGTAVEHSAMSCFKMHFSSDTSSQVMSLLGINMHTSLIPNPSVREPDHTVLGPADYAVLSVISLGSCSQAPSSIPSVHARGDPKNEASNCFQYYWDSILHECPRSQASSSMASQDWLCKTSHTPVSWKRTVVRVFHQFVCGETLKRGLQFAFSIFVSILEVIGVEEWKDQWIKGSRWPPNCYQKRTAAIWPLTLEN